MKKNLLFICAILLLFCVLAACNSATQQEKISNEIGIDVSKGKEISSYDTHSGNRDGVSCFSWIFSEDEILQQIKNDRRWEKLPTNRAVEILVYGICDENGIIGPFLSNQNGRNLIPRIQNGYYLFIDRHSDKGENQDIFGRNSFNFTVAFYDIDNNILYYGELDT